MMMDTNYWELVRCAVIKGLHILQDEDLDYDLFISLEKVDAAISFTINDNLCSVGIGARRTLNAVLKECRINIDGHLNFVFLAPDLEDLRYQLNGVGDFATRCKEFAENHPEEEFPLGDFQKAITLAAAGAQDLDRHVGAVYVCKTFPSEQPDYLDYSFHMKGEDGISPGIVEKREAENWLQGIKSVVETLVEAQK